MKKKAIKYKKIGIINVKTIIEIIVKRLKIG